MFSFLVHVLFGGVDQGGKICGGALGGAAGSGNILRQGEDFGGSLGENHQEFVAAQTVGGGGGGEGTKKVGGFGQKTVAGSVALGVVDLLEVVQIQIKDGQNPAGRKLPAVRRKSAAVEKAGEGVDLGLAVKETGFRCQGQEGCKGGNQTQEESQRKNKEKGGKERQEDEKRHEMSSFL